VGAFSWRVAGYGSDANAVSSCVVGFARGQNPVPSWDWKPASVVLGGNGRHSDRNPYSEPARISRFSLNLGLSLDSGACLDSGRDDIQSALTEIWSQSQVGIGKPTSVVLRRNGRRSNRNPYSEPVRIGWFSLKLGLRFDRGCPPLDLHTDFPPRMASMLIRPL
jgi:hypothetical protein